MKEHILHTLFKLLDKMVDKIKDSHYAALSGDAYVLCDRNDILSTGDQLTAIGWLESIVGGDEEVVLALNKNYGTIQIDINNDQVFIMRKKYIRDYTFYSTDRCQSISKNVAKMLIKMGDV